jgi:uncharacterized membrane protein
MGQIVDPVSVPDVPYQEPRWPALICVDTVILLGELPVGLTWPLAAIVAVLSLAGIASKKWHIQLGYANSAIATLIMGHALYQLLDDLVAKHKTTPVQLLASSLVIWSMNILVFATWYWRLDAGGPHKRSKHHKYRDGAFLFPQLTLPGEHGQWRPNFVDYLFLSFNTSTAFSPTDVPVLSRWAKVLMMVQSSISLTTLAVVAARAVNTLAT